MTSEHQFDALLRSWLDEVAPAGQPQGLLESVQTATAHTRPRPAWLVRLLGEPMPETDRPGLNRFAPLTLAATVVLVALLIGIGLMVRPPIGPPSPTPSEHPSPSELAGPSAGPTSSVVPGPAGVWIATGTMGTPRSGHTAVRLLDGRVLVAGGSGANDSGGVGGNEYHLTSAELYDPDSGTWSATGDMAKPHDGFPATLLRDGKVLVGVALSEDRPGAELYDPNSGTWSATGPMVGGGVTATLLRDGKVLVIGDNGSELYDPDTGTWTATASKAAQRHSHAAILLPDGRVLVAGGHAPGDFPTDSAELYDPDTGSWTAIENMHAKREAIVAFLQPDGKVLVVGSSGGDPLSVELYDPATGAWTATGDMGTPGISVNESTTLLSDGRLLVAHASGDTRTVELYDPGTGTWTTTAPMLRSHGTPAILLLDGTVLVAGGWDCLESGVCVATGSAELYVPAGVSPPSGRWPVTEHG